MERKPEAEEPGRRLFDSTVVPASIFSRDHNVYQHTHIGMRGSARLRDPAMTSEDFTDSGFVPIMTSCVRGWENMSCVMLQRPVSSAGIALAYLHIHVNHIAVALMGPHHALEEALEKTRPGRE